MATTYWYKGSRWRDYITLQNAVGTLVTGEAANFTVTINNGAGNVATTGVTVSEVDAGSNPGVYAITADPLTSFVTTNGHYNILAYNSTEDLRFREILIVTDTDIPATYIDGAGFTASAGDGRVTDGASALEGVTVTVLDSTNAVVYQSQTDSDGFWSAILDDGTYSVTTYLSNYASTTATLTMAAGAGSIGSDITMTSTVSTSLTASELIAYTRRQMGDNVGSKANTQIEESINAAMRNVARDFNTHPWWESDGTVTLRSEYGTGTIAVTSGSTTVTLTGGTWPSWAASAEIYIDGTWFFVTSRDSGSDLTLSDAYPGDTLTASSYSLVQVEYAMPTDLAMFGQIVFYKDTWPYGAEPTSYEEVQKFKHMRQQVDSRKLWAAHGSNFAVWPPPPSDVVARFLYRRMPAKMSYSSPASALDFDPLLRDVLEAAIDYQLARRGLYDGQTNPKEAYEDARKSAMTATSKRPSSRPSMGGRRRFTEPRLSYNQEL